MLIILVAIILLYDVKFNYYKLSQYGCMMHIHDAQLYWCLMHRIEPYWCWYTSCDEHWMHSIEPWRTVLSHIDAWCKSLRQIETYVMSHGWSHGALSHGCTSLSHNYACMMQWYWAILYWCLIHNIELYWCLMHSIEPYWWLMHSIEAAWYK